MENNRVHIAIYLSGGDIQEVISEGTNVTVTYVIFDEDAQRVGERSLSEGEAEQVRDLLAVLEEWKKGEEQSDVTQ